MTYKDRFGRFEIRDGENGLCYKWFKDRTKAVEHFNWMKSLGGEEWSDDFADEVVLVNSKDGKVIDRFGVTD